MNVKSILASLALTLVLVAPAFAAPQGSCCDAVKCGAACSKAACCDAPCCSPASGKSTRLVKKAVVNAKARFVLKKGASCCGMPCCDGGACCATTARGR